MYIYTYDRPTKPDDSYISMATEDALLENLPRKIENVFGDDFLAARAVEGDLFIEMEAELSPEDEAVLDGIIANFEGL